MSDTASDLDFGEVQNDEVTGQQFGRAGEPQLGHRPRPIVEIGSFGTGWHFIQSWVFLAGDLNGFRCGLFHPHARRKRHCGRSIGKQHRTDSVTELHGFCLSQVRAFGLASELPHYRTMGKLSQPKETVR